MVQADPEDVTSVAPEPAPRRSENLFNTVFRLKTYGSLYFSTKLFDTVVP